LILIVALDTSLLTSHNLARGQLAKTMFLEPNIPPPGLDWQSIKTEITKQRNNLLQCQLMLEEPAS
jgi:hypothetical protein